MKKLFVNILLSACALVGSIMAQPSSSSVPEDAKDPAWVKGIRPTGPVVNIKELGAKGDGVTNDSAAFREAAKIIEKAKGGTLYIPLGTYIVGEQTHGEQTTDRDPYYKPLAVFHIKEVSGLIIEGNGATLKLAPGLHYGSFDNKDGKRIDPELRFIDRSKRADIGSMIDIYRSKDILIRNLELDGNNASIIQGGKWGDKGRQCDAYGLRLYNNSNVLIENVYSHHHGLDGIIIGYRQLKEEDPPTPHLLINVHCEYNGRQGLSWVGGRGLTVLRSKFNHTGMAAIDSSPRSGVDIEAENSICRDGYFEECEMIGNHGPGMLADSGDGGYTKFVRCVFWGTQNYSIWCKKPGLLFEDCKIYGAGVHTFGSPDSSLSTTFIRCHFEDKPWTDGRVYGRHLYEADGPTENARWEDCTFVANEVRSLWIGENHVKKYMINCTITHRSTQIPDDAFQAVLRGVVLERCTFKEDFPDGGSPAPYYINVENVEVRGETIVEGPDVSFFKRMPAGALGVLEERLWNPVSTN